MVYTLQRLIFLAISSGVSVRLMRLPSASADLDIFAVPSTSDMTRAPAGGISASGTCVEPRHPSASTRSTTSRCGCVVVGQLAP